MKTLKAALVGGAITALCFGSIAAVSHGETAKASVWGFWIGAFVLSFIFFLAGEE